MLEVNHVDDDCVWCYNDKYLTTREFIAIGNILLINLYINTLISLQDNPT